MTDELEAVLSAFAAAGGRSLRGFLRETELFIEKAPLLRRGMRLVDEDWFLRTEPAWSVVCDSDGGSTQSSSRSSSHGATWRDMLALRRGASRGRMDELRRVDNQHGSKLDR